MLIQEVILENFMSYDYARVPFKQGVNVICGPNGSGKSSLLLAISVALGQSYTERSRKLSNLIRWGKDQARVTLILDNIKKGNSRPIPKINKDQIFLTRVLRKDGQYWFELENKAADKQDIQRILTRLGVEPDNILIIMHQNMVEQFTILPTSEKLAMVEAAVGLQPYRENVAQAQKKLTRILSQEDSIGKLLETAQQTLNYWREQYDRYQQKKQLQAKQRFLEREILWAETQKRETIVRNLQSEKTKKQNILATFQKETIDTNTNLTNSQTQLDQQRNEYEDLLDRRIILEQQKARDESTTIMAQQILQEITLLENPTINPAIITQLRLLRTDNLKTLIEITTRQQTKTQTEIENTQIKSTTLQDSIDKTQNDLLDNRIRLALLKYQQTNAQIELESIQNELDTAETHLHEAQIKAEQAGPRIAIVKTVPEILDEIRVTQGHLAALTDVSEDIERMYETYSKLYYELKDKAQLVQQNREKTLEEVKTRMQAWKTVIQTLLEKVNLEYQKILTQTQAEGLVRLVDEQDIEAAGLEILVGFKGGQPVPLDAYTQSGGERTTATMSFLLALQKHVRSPFRAVDEYDVHMDPKNRELIAQMLIDTVKDGNAQYAIITPSQITFAAQDTNIITVQNIEGKSIIREVA